jgi:hypothetical protein
MMLPASETMRPGLFHEALPGDRVPRPPNRMPMPAASYSPLKRLDAAARSRAASKVCSEAALESNAIPVPSDRVKCLRDGAAGLDSRLGVAPFALRATRYALRATRYALRAIAFAFAGALVADVPREAALDSLLD